MYFMAVALDYDGTLACEGKVEAETIEALVKLKASGRKLIMVTGRQLDELQKIFDRFDLFDRIVAENGALIYTPQVETQRLLAKPPSKEFVSRLMAHDVVPLMIGNVIVATQEPHEVSVLEVIREMGLGLDIIFNKGAVMVLPSGVNKATGLAAALQELKLSMHNVIGIGDAENDHAFLNVVGLGVAVADAYDAVKQTASLVTKEASGKGVEELIDQLLKDEYALVSLVKQRIFVGLDNQNIPVELNAMDRVLIAGNSGIGKSTLATALTEKMVDHGFQFCIFDPEGDYENLENAIGIGEVDSAPSMEQIIEVLSDPVCNVVVNALGLKLEERPSFFEHLAPKLVSLKAKTGRPHWLIIDEAHHLMPIAREGISHSLPKKGTILITVHPGEIPADVLKELSIAIILGPQAPEILKNLSQMVGNPLPDDIIKAPADDEFLLWEPSPINKIKIVKAERPKQQHKRHTRKYAIGDLTDEYSFYFRGPNDALKLKAQNLMIFLQIAEGIDDATWMHHLHKKDYSDWFRKHIKDNVLADAAAQVESDPALSAVESRAQIFNLVRKLYTAPASSNN